MRFAQALRGETTRSISMRKANARGCSIIIVACELRYGAAKRGSQKLTRQVEMILGAITILSLEAGTDRHYAAIRTALEKKGTPIGANDLLIAAQARAIEAICVTANVAKFKRVPHLKVENWLD